MYIHICMFKYMYIYIYISICIYIHSRRNGSHGDFLDLSHFFGSPRSRILPRQVKAPSKILSESVRKFKKKQGVSEKNHFEIYYICIYINRLCWQRKKSIHIYMYTSIYISIYIYMYIYIYICI